MAQIRTLKLNLLADVTKFGAGMVEARGDINKLSTVATRAGTAVAAAFTGMAVAAGYAAIAIGKDSVQAALEDEASQKRLETMLKNVTGATDDQIKANERWVTQQQFKTGFTDSAIRSSLGKLVGVTKDLTEAQDLNTLAMDISRGTGKDLESVSTALVKAHEGNLGALTKLGVPLDEATKKSGNFEQATKSLTDMFGGQAAAYTETYQGKLDLVNQKIGELKESLGASLIDRFGNLLTVVNDVANGFSGNTGSLASSMSAVSREGLYTNEGETLGASIKKLADSFTALFKAINGDDGTQAKSNLQIIADTLTAVAEAIDKVTRAYERAKNGAILEKLGFSSLLGGFGLLPNKLVIPNFGRANGGSVRAGQAYTVGEFGKETFIPTTSGRIVPNAGGGNVTINLNGIIDAESARRSIERLLQDSGRRTAAINLVGSPL